MHSSFCVLSRLMEDKWSGSERESEGVRVGSDEERERGLSADG